MADRAVPSHGVNSTSEFDALMNYQFGNTNGRNLSMFWFLSFAVCTVAVVLRVCARTKVGPARGLRLDDYILFFSWLLFAAGTGMGGYVVSVGYGTGLPETYGRTQEMVLMMIYIGGLFGIVAIAICKLSLGMLYWYLLRGVGRLRWYAFANMVFLLLTTIATILWRTLCCLSVGVMANWDISDDPVRIDKQIKCTVCNFYMLNGQYIMALISDIFFIALAVPLLRRADLSRHEKMGVFTMFALVSLTIVASTIREAVMFKNRDLMLILTWGFVECSLSIIVTSAIAMRALANSIRKRLKAWWQSDPSMKSKGVLTSTLSIQEITERSVSIASKRHAEVPKLVRESVGPVGAAASHEEDALHGTTQTQDDYREMSRIQDEELGLNVPPAAIISTICEEEENRSNRQTWFEDHESPSDDELEKVNDDEEVPQIPGAAI